MRGVLKQFILKLERDAASNVYTGEHGSPVTSMSEDHMLGELGKEQLRIAKVLKKILTLN